MLPDPIVPMFMMAPLYFSGSVLCEAPTCLPDTGCCPLPELGEDYQKNIARSRIDLLIAFLSRTAQANGCGRKDLSRDACSTRLYFARVSLNRHFMDCRSGRQGNQESCAHRIADDVGAARPHPKAMVSARALMVDSPLISFRSFVKNGTRPQRAKMTLRSPVSLLWRMMG